MLGFSFSAQEVAIEPFMIEIMQWSHETLGMNPQRDREGSRRRQRREAEEAVQLKFKSSYAPSP